MDYFEDVWYHADVKEENPFLMLLTAPTKEKMDISLISKIYCLSEKQIKKIELSMLCQYLVFLSSSAPWKKQYKLI